MTGRVPLAVVVVDDEGLVSHWSEGARRLFGADDQAAVGRPATDLLPVSGALMDRHYEDVLDDVPYDGADLAADPEGQLSFQASGRARLTGPAGARIDVLWWAYPLVGPGADRLLVLAVDASGLPTGTLAYTDAVERVAPGFALHTDFPGADGLARALPGILPGMSGADSARLVDQVLELGYPVLEFSQHDRVPVTPEWEVPPRPAPVRHAPLVASGPLTDSAEHARPSGGARDHTYAAEPDPAAARERLEFLNEVSGRIGSSLDLARTIEEISRAVAPRFTDAASIYLREQVVADEEFAAGPPEPATRWLRVAAELTGEPRHRHGMLPPAVARSFAAHSPFFRCVRAGEPVMVPRIDRDIAAAIAAQFPQRDLRPLITGGSLLVVPLGARDRVLGFMALLRHPGRPVFDDADRDTGAVLADRAALVLDNARRYAHQESLARRLRERIQRGGTPPGATTRTPGCDIVTGALPVGPDGDGHWCDTVRLPAQRTALVVGDVLGRGLDASTAAGQLRTAVQTMAALDLPPARLLGRLDDLARQLGEHYLATCLYAVYDPVAGELRVASAGHVPPVLVRSDGRGERLDVPVAAPVGVGGPPPRTTRVPVDSGDRLVLCTDALVEVRGSGVGLASLCAGAVRRADSLDEACDGLIRALDTGVRRAGGPAGGGEASLLVARLAGIASEDVAHWTLSAEPREVRRARALVRSQLCAWGLEEVSERAQLLAGELVTNAVRHAAPGPVALRLVRGGTALTCEVEDTVPTLPTRLDCRPEDEFGRGLRVVSGLARGWGSSRTAAGKRVWFELALPGPGA